MLLPFDPRILSVRYTSPFGARTEPTMEAEAERAISG